jgi:hypothetical protein
MRLLPLLALSACSTAQGLRVPDPSARATVLFFLMTDCPIANAYAPEIRRICESHLDVAFVAVYVDPTQDAAKHAAEYGIPCRVVVDDRREIVRRVGATMTPEAAVLRPDGSVAYLGRIDDLFVGYKQRRHAPTRRDLREAIGAVLKGEPVAVPRTPVVGCFIPGENP